ncbi:MAG: hypothetical protein AB8I08_22505 [Sandaracinaceae bacterium]
MLVVLMVLMMTTATATFAIHSTTVEMRSAGYGRQALQTEYVAQGAVFAGMAQIDAITPRAAYEQHRATTVDADTPYVPGSESFDRGTNVLRFRQEDFATAAGVNAAPLETNPSATPSLGDRSIYSPDFLIDGTDVYTFTASSASGPATEQSGHNPMRYFRINLTSRATLSINTDTVDRDTRLSGDDRDFHETISFSRAQIVAGPVGGL